MSFFRTHNCVRQKCRILLQVTPKTAAPRARDGHTRSQYHVTAMSWTGAVHLAHGRVKSGARWSERTTLTALPAFAQTPPPSVRVSTPWTTVVCSHNTWCIYSRVTRIQGTARSRAGRNHNVAHGVPIRYPDKTSRSNKTPRSNPHVHRDASMAQLVVDVRLERRVASGGRIDRVALGLGATTTDAATGSSLTHAATADDARACSTAATVCPTGRRATVGAAGTTGASPTYSTGAATQALDVQASRQGGHTATGDSRRLCAVATAARHGSICTGNGGPTVRQRRRWRHRRQSVGVQRHPDRQR